MSLSSTGNIKVQLTANLGSRASTYFEALKLFVAGQTSRAEFEDTVRQLLDTPNLVQLHNALIISLFDATVVHRRPPTPPPPTLPKPPPRKRRRPLLPYQGTEIPDSALTLRSSRLKRWVLAVGKRERERLQSLPVTPFVGSIEPRREMDEITRERGVALLQERGEAPGSRLPVHLHATTHAPTIQHIADRINLVCAQNNLGTPARNVPSLLNLACEAKLKQLITHALTLTSTSSAISSINPSIPPLHSQKLLSASAFHSLFTLKPSELPNKSATAMQLSLGDRDDLYDEDAVGPFNDRETHDERWQLMALLGERSTVKDVLRGARL